MGGVDLANQYREAYEVHRTTQRNWWPLFYWLIDVTCVNAYRLYYLYNIQQGQKPLEHKEFRIELYTKLFNYSSQAKLHQLRVGLGGKRVFGPELAHLHYWTKRATRSSCAWCLYESRCNKVLGKGIKGPVKHSLGGCIFCNVALCQEGQCWARFHLNHHNY